LVVVVVVVVVMVVVVVEMGTMLCRELGHLQQSIVLLCWIWRKFLLKLFAIPRRHVLF